MVFCVFFVLFCYYSSVTDKLFYKTEYITNKEQWSLQRFIESAIAWPGHVQYNHSLCRMSHDEKSLIKHWHIGMFDKMQINCLFFHPYVFLDS